MNIHKHIIEFFCIFFFLITLAKVAFSKCPFLLNSKPFVSLFSSFYCLNWRSNNQVFKISDAYRGAFIDASIIFPSIRDFVDESRVSICLDKQIITDKLCKIVFYCIMYSNYAIICNSYRIKEIISIFNGFLSIVFDTLDKVLDSYR